MQRVLFRNGSPVALTPRAFDVLAVLVGNAGRIVSKDDLMQAVWGKTIVEEGTLNWQVFSLRQKLSEGDESLSYIETVPKRGYRFAATVLAAAPPGSGPSPASPAPPSAETAANPTEVPARTRILKGVATVMGVCALALAGYWWLRPVDPVLPYAARDWLLVTDFENQTGDPRFDQALLTAFTVSLEQSKYVNVFSRARVATTLQRMRKPPQSRIDEAIAREICARENIRALVTPTVTRSGREYALAARLVDPVTGNAVKSYLISAKDENAILNAVQETASRLRRDLGESVAAISANNRPMARVTTPVLAALQQFSEGVQLSQQAKFGESVQRFEAAIAADPEFAMAYAALGRAHYSPVFNRPDLGAEYFQRAIALSSRVTDRERMLIVADFAMNRGHTEEALNLYAAYLTAYPSDFGIHSRLGDLYANAGQFANAAGRYSAALKIDPSNVNLLNSTAAALANLGQFSKALDYLKRAIQIDSTVLERFNFRYNYGMILLGAGETQKAREWFLRTTDGSGLGQQSQRALGLIEQYSGHYRTAARYFARAIGAPAENSQAELSRSRNHSFLAATLAAQGDRRGALEQLRLAVIALDKHGRAGIEFRARIARSFARLGDLSAAAVQERRVVSEADANKPRDRAEVQQLAGELEMARGHGSKALSLMEAAVQGSPGIDSPLALESLGKAAIAAGDSARAIAAYRELVDIKGQWVGWEAQEAWLLAHLELARLYRDDGKIPEARQTLDGLLTRWRDADPDLPAMMAAQKLKSELAATH
jgi:DNA-binding winged helix-turn-helix (wHTH) protein/tetratricopeptide (TPR) repeat protein